MKASELRIGNWINGRIGYNIQVTSDVIMRVEQGIYNYTPIPLTEEILLGCGFVYTETELPMSHILKDYRKGQFVINLIPKVGAEVEFNPIASDPISERCYIVAVKHLHQLQNLYIALTGEELNIKSEIEHPKPEIK